MRMHLECLLAALAVAGCATAPKSVGSAAEKEPFLGKNCADVVWRTLPSDPAEVRATSDWNFNFRPYRKSSAEWLVSDPAVQRAAVQGASTDVDLTGVSVTCDAEGFTVSVLCTDKSLANAYATTNALASPTIEIFVMPGDADVEAIVPHNMTAGPMADMREYPDVVQDRDFRHVRPFMTCTEDMLENAFLCRIRYDWAAFRDRLPIFGDRADNFWRLSVIRWSAGGRTWGGAVHQISQAGYLRWPKFTEAQKTAIEAATLRKGWAKFNAFIRTPEISYGNSYVDPTGWVVPFKETERAAGRTYVNENEDPAFRPEMLKIVNAGKALGPGIATFAKRPPAERDAFYKMAQDKLFNVGYDMKRAYEKYATEKIFGHKEAK